jgi:hypothetical protein
MMENRGRSELNGSIVEVVRKQSGGKKPGFVDSNGTIHGEGRWPARYYLNIGIKVGAANLKKIENIKEIEEVKKVFPVDKWYHHLFRCFRAEMLKPKILNTTKRSSLIEIRAKG